MGFNSVFKGLITVIILGYIYIYTHTHTHTPLRDSPYWARTSSLSTLHVHMVKHTTVCKTPLDERSARSRDLYLTTHNYKRQTSVSPERFEQANPPSEQPQKFHALDRAATGIGRYLYSSSNTIITSQACILHCVLTGALVG